MTNTKAPEMVERVARLLVIGNPDSLVYVDEKGDRATGWSQNDRQVPLWTLGVPRATRIIEAMREPTEAMAGEGFGHSDFESPGMFDSGAESMKQAWRAMIDASLSQTEG